MTEEQVVSLVKKTIQLTENRELVDVFIALINWPFLLFVFLILFVLIYRKKIVGLLERGDIQISWGENRHIKLKELSDGIDEELDPILDEISEIQERIKKLEADANRGGAVQEDQEATIDDDRYSDAEQRMIEGLESHKYRWRSIERLAKISAITEHEALDILRANQDIVLSVGKSGRQIVRLKDR